MRSARTKQRSTINEVAERAGVAKTTVSHAISGKRPVAAETREQVLGSLKTVYSTRYAGDATGLEPLLTKLQAEYAPKP